MLLILSSNVHHSARHEPGRTLLNDLGELLASVPNRVSFIKSSSGSWREEPSLVRRDQKPPPFSEASA